MRTESKEAGEKKGKRGERACGYKKKCKGRK